MRQGLLRWLAGSSLAFAVLAASSCARTDAALVAVDAPSAHGQTALVGDGQPLGVGAGIEPDAEMAALLAPFEEGVAPLRVRVATNAQTLERGTGGGAAGAWLADVMLDRAKKMTGADIVMAITNAGGVRAPLPEGDVTRETLYAVMPFDNSLVIYDLDAEQFQELLEFLADRAPYFPVAGGIVDRLTLHQGALFIIDGEAYEPGESNMIATHNFLAGGGDNAQLFVDFGEYLDLEIFLRELMVEWAEELDARGEVITMPDNVPRYNVIN